MRTTTTHTTTIDDATTTILANAARIVKVGRKVARRFRNDERAAARAAKAFGRRVCID